MGMTRLDHFEVHLSENLTEGERCDVAWLLDEHNKLLEAVSVMREALEQMDSLSVRNAGGCFCHKIARQALERLEKLEAETDKR